LSPAAHEIAPPEFHHLAFSCTLQAFKWAGLPDIKRTTRLCTFAFFLGNRWVKHRVATLSDFAPLPMYWLEKPAQRRIPPRESNSVEEESESCISLKLWTFMNARLIPGEDGD
jgi:hypothetical protein